MSSYELMLSRQATERFLRMPIRERQKLFDFFDRLTLGHYAETEPGFTDDEGQKFKVLPVGRLTITF
ncbi:MAG: hypothetical protein AAGJ81_16045 [Verrucomicrobiota bacterium]